MMLILDEQEWKESMRQYNSTVCNTCLQDELNSSTAEKKN